MKNKKTTTLLVLLALLSLFTFLVTNGHIIFLCQNLFNGGVAVYHTLNERNALRIDTFLWISLLLIQIGLLVLPFIYKKRQGRNLVFYLPLLFLFIQFLSLGSFSFVLIPFIITWLILLNFFKK